MRLEWNLNGIESMLLLISQIVNLERLMKYFLIALQRIILNKENQLQFNRAIIYKLKS